MKRTLRWIAVNTALAIAAYFALAHDHVNAANIVKFLIGLTLFNVVLLVCSETVRGMIHKAGRPVPVWLDWMYDIIMLFAFVWFGWFWTAGIYLAHSVLAHGCYNGTFEETE